MRVPRVERMDTGMRILEERGRVGESKYLLFLPTLKP